MHALLVIGLTGSAQSAEPEASPGEWKLVSNKDGVALYRRQRPATYESKAIGEIAAPTALVHAVIDDVESYTSFMPYTAECRVLKRDGDSVVAYQLRAAHERSRLHRPGPVELESRRGRHQLPQQMGNK